MKTLKLTIAYDGTNYCGWQRQDESGKAAKRVNFKPSIQGQIEAILSRILQEKVSVQGSGRTDAGVHALAQIAHARIHKEVDCKKLLKAANQLLDDDITITAIKEVNAQFHARFDALKKRYRYRIFTGKVLSPFIRNYVYHVKYDLNVSRMRSEMKGLLGCHDFRSFARVEEEKQTRRRVSDVRLMRKKEELWFEIEGSGFLHTMVRSIIGTLIDIGRGRLPAGTIKKMLKTRDRILAGTTAPAKGLFLISVEYKR